MVLAPAPAGSRVSVWDGTRVVAEITALEEIPRYHKLALQPLAKGAIIYKYGEVIGRAIQAIQTGAHVHVHNIEGVAVAHGD